MDLTTGIVFGEDYYGDEVNELAVVSFNYVKLSYPNSSWYLRISIS